MDWTIKDSLEESSTEQPIVFSNLITTYNNLFNFDESKSIRSHMAVMKKISETDKNFVIYFFNELNEYNIALSSLTGTLKILNQKIIDFSKDNYIGYSKAKLLNMMEMCSNINTCELITDEDLIQLSKQADTQLKSDSIEYSLIRLLCVCKTLGLITTSCYIANLIITQENVI